LEFFEIRDRGFQGSGDHLNHRRREREGRRDQNVIAAFAVNATLSGIGHDCGFERVRLNAGTDARVGGKGLASPSVANELDAAEQAFTSNVADN
jgi:hypothetical protein